MLNPMPIKHIPTYSCGIAFVTVMSLSETVGNSVSYFTFKITLENKRNKVRKGKI